MQVFVNEIVPCNDAGISLGQAYVLRERLMTGRGKEWSGAHSEREPIRGR
jgi:hypothetical protein